MSRTPSQDFSPRNLGWMRRWRSQDHLQPKTGSYPNGASEWDVLLTSISNAIASDSFKFERLRSLVLRNKATLTTKSLEETLVLRKINDNIRRAYGLSQPNRDQLVRTARQALEETTPKTVIRIDISKCFESINRKKLLSKLREDGLVSFESIALLEQLFNSSRRLSPAISRFGLPRGIIVSTSLAEIYLREIDHQIRSISGVYLMLRYVDDLLIFSTTRPQDVLAEVTTVLRQYGLTSNPKKLDTATVECRCTTTCDHGQNCPCKSGCKCYETNKQAFSSIEFLGYRFAFSPHNASKKGKANQVFCLLSEKKIKRIKSRMHHAFRAHRAKPDIDLLGNRLAFLSSNIAVKRIPGQAPLLSGLSYSHSQYNEPDDPTIFPTGRISELDRFMRTHLRRIAGVDPSIMLAPVWTISFESAFSKRRRVRLSAAELIEIGRCWAND